jgi:sugar phosphate isomerase/epimerase
MKFGVCIGSDSQKIEISKRLGYDYVESCFSLLADKNEESNYEVFREKLIENGIPCLSVNCFLPSSLKVTGDQVDYDALTEYIDRGMRRGAALGVKKIVFGSGGARNLPDGFPYKKGMEQLIYFLREIVSPIAEKYGLITVIEPLSTKDTNVIQSL